MGWQEQSCVPGLVIAAMVPVLTVGVWAYIWVQQSVAVAVVVGADDCVAVAVEADAAADGALDDAGPVAAMIWLAKVGEMLSAAGFWSFVTRSCWERF